LTRVKICGKIGAYCVSAARALYHIKVLKDLVKILTGDRNKKEED